MTLRQTRHREERHDLGALRLYREDLAAIATAVAEIGELRIKASEQPVTLRRGGYGYDYQASSPEDFADMPDQLAEVVIQGRKTSPPGGGISVTLGRRSAQAVLYGPDTLMSGVLMRVQQICELRRRRLRSLVPARARDSLLPGLMVAALAAVAGVMALAYALGGGGAMAKWSASDTLTMAIAGILVIAAAGLEALATRPAVRIVNAPERPSYWQRTRDSWVVGVTTAVFGTALGFLLGKII